MTELFWAFYFFQTKDDCIIIILLISSLEYLHHCIFKVNINSEIIYCCFQLLPQGINIMMTSALKTCFIIFFSKIKMDLCKIAKSLCLSLCWILILYRACTHICYTGTCFRAFYYSSPKFFSFSQALLLSSFCILTLKSQNRLLPY